MKLSDNERLYVDIVKQNMVDLIEPGVLKPEEQYNVVESTLQKLLLINKPEVTEAVDRYFKDQFKMKESIKDKESELRKLVEDYSENVKKIYEQIKKL